MTPPSLGDVNCQPQPNFLIPLELSWLWGNSETHSVMGSLFSSVKRVHLRAWGWETGQLLTSPQVGSSSYLLWKMILASIQEGKPRLHTLWSCAKIPWLERTPWKKDSIIAVPAPKPNTENSNQYNMHTLYYVGTHFLFCECGRSPMPHAQSSSLVFWNGRKQCVPRKIFPSTVPLLALKYKGQFSPASLPRIPN